MSVIIKDMEMPTSCDNCRFSGRGGLMNERVVCMFTGANAYMNTVQYLDDCPLVPVPPHGDLIDRDALEADTEWDNREDGYISYSRVAIECAPTIIEAEECEQ